MILPGPQFSDFAPQDFHSFVGIGRLRYDLGTSFGGLLLTDREISGGGHNRVIGPDFQWAIGSADKVTGQFLYSDSEEPDRPDLSPAFDGREISGHALSLDWRHDKQKFFTELLYADVSDGFRADEGFVPQVGYREGLANAGLRFYPTSGLFSFLQPRVGLDYFEDRGGELLSRRSLSRGGLPGRAKPRRIPPARTSTPFASERHSCTRRPASSTSRSIRTAASPGSALPAPSGS